MTGKRRGRRGKDKDKPEPVVEPRPPEEVELPPDVPRLPTADERRASARTSKFNERNRQAILNAIQGGAWRNQAAALAGVGERTIKRWIALGRENLAAIEAYEEGDGPEVELDDYGLFCAKVLQAEEIADANLVQVVVDLAGSPTVPPRDRIKAATWLLERRNRKRYGPGPVAVTGPDGGPVEIDARTVLADRLADLAARQGTGEDPGEPDA